MQKAMAVEQTFEVSVSRTIKCYNFKVTLNMEGYLDYLNIVPRSLGKIDFGTFPVGPNDELQLQVTWFARFAKGNAEHPKMIIKSAKQKMQEIWIINADCSIKTSTGLCTAPNKFKTPITFFENSKMEVFVSEFSSVISDDHKFYLPNGNLCIILKGTIKIPYTDVCRHYVPQEISIPEKSIFETDLEALLNSENYCDIYISCDNQNFSAHRNILWARAPKFIKMLENVTEELKEAGSIIKISDISAAAFQECLIFMYTGKINIGIYAKELLKFSTKYEMGELKNICEARLIKEITAENVCHYYIFGEELSSKSVKSACLTFIRINGKSVMETPGWKSFVVSHSHVVANIMERMIVVDEFVIV